MLALNRTIEPTEEKVQFSFGVRVSGHNWAHKKFCQVVIDGGADSASTSLAAAVCVSLWAKCGLPQAGQEKRKGKGSAKIENVHCCTVVCDASVGDSACWNVIRTLLWSQCQFWLKFTKYTVCWSILTAHCHFVTLSTLTKATVFLNE